MNLLLIALLCALAGIIYGQFLFFNPDLAIKKQIKFYAKINWRMEPISMEKEIKSTSRMGLLLAIFSLLTVFYIKFFAISPFYFR